MVKCHPGSSTQIVIELHIELLLGCDLLAQRHAVYHATKEASSNMFKPAALGLSSTALVCLARIFVCWKPKLWAGQRIQEQLGVGI